MLGHEVVISTSVRHLRKQIDAAGMGICVTQLDGYICKLVIQLFVRNKFLEKVIERGHWSIIRKMPELCI